MSKIDLENHFLIPEILEYFTGRTEFPVYYPEKKQMRYNADYPFGTPVNMPKLLQSPEERIADMDAFDVSMQVLSSAPGITGVQNPEDAKVLCRKANEYIHEAMIRLRE